MIQSFFQTACSKCLKAGFKSAQSLREHMTRCDYCRNCQCYRSTTHIRTCNVNPENMKRCEVCSKWLQKSNLPRHLRMHRAQLDETQVKIV